MLNLRSGQFVAKDEFPSLCLLAYPSYRGGGDLAQKLTVKGPREPSGISLTSIFKRMNK